MTICVAVLAGGAVFGMSDRMLTAGDIQFQPASSKLWKLTPSVVMMPSGDVGLHALIHSQMAIKIAAREREDPLGSVTVETIAEEYRQAYFEIKRRFAEKDILAPLGLDSESFLARQAGMEPNLVAKITMELIGYQMAGVAAIIAGCNPAHDAQPEKDLFTPHIFSITDGALHCADKIGFACVGIGASHANSTLMSAGHSPNTPIPKALLTLYAAKRRAEVAPGVGTETDFFVVTSSADGYSSLRDEIRDRVISAYDNQMKGYSATDAEAEKSLSAYIEEIIIPKQPSEPTATN